MAVTSNLADKLLPYATGPAVDVLFSDSEECNITTESNPTPGLVLKRWPSLSAQAAIRVAENITDVDLLDALAGKEKRKTVRVAIARNPNVHPITRLYFLQEGLRSKDHDLVTVTLSRMEADMLVGLALCSDVNGRIRNRDIAEAILGVEDRSIAIHALKNYPAMYDLTSIICFMLGISTDKAVSLLDEAGIALDSLDFSTFEASQDASPVVLRRLIQAAQGTNRVRYMSRCAAYFSDQLEKLEAIDPALLANAVSELRRIDETVVSVYKRNDMLHLLIKSLRGGVTISEKAAEMMAESATSDDELVALAYNHPDPVLASRLLVEPAIFAEKARSVGATDFQRWLNRLAPSLDIETVFAMLSIQDKPDLGQQWTSRFATSLGMPVEVFVDQIPDSLLRYLVGISESADVFDYDKLLRRASANSVEAVEKIAALILDSRYAKESTQSTAARLLLGRDRVDALYDWLLSASEETVATLLPEHLDVVLKAYFQFARGNRWRLSWTGLIVEHLAPEQGWGSMPGKALEGAMKILNENIGDDATVWVTVLNLFEDWTGTLDELIAAARSL